MPLYVKILSLLVKMESTTNSILTFNCSIVYKIMNEYVLPESKRQHTQLSFILHLTFNKFKTFPKAFTLASNQFWKMFLPWVKISLIQSSFKQSFTKCLNWLKLKHLVFDRLPLAFFLVGCFAKDLFLLSFVNFSHLHVYFGPCCLGFLFYFSPFTKSPWGRWGPSSSMHSDFIIF
jgi:hypothetical protein